MGRIKQWLKYYRASLIDSAEKPRNNVLESCINRETSFLDQLELSEVKGLQNICNQKLFVIKEKDEEIETEWAAIQIAPIFLVNEFEHTKNRDGGLRHYPFWITARVNKDGCLLPPAENELPVFMRPYLAPNPQDLPVVADIEQLDEVLSKSAVNLSCNNWTEYWADCEELFEHITGKRFCTYHKGKVQFAFCVYGNTNMTRNIRNLYDQLLDEIYEPENELMRVLLSEQEESRNWELNSRDSRQAIFLNKNHYGQMRCDFPLSKSQRIAFAEYLEDTDNRVFAVNGPPGTGKTTLLQSIIANHIVMPVLNAQEPILMVGCSTNNQAITNILDSMQFADDMEDGLAKRWLPDIAGFGLYLTSEYNNKTSQKIYQQATNNFLNDGFIGNIDQKDRLPEFETFYLECAIQELGLSPTSTFSKVKKALKGRIETAKRALDAVLDKVTAFENIPEVLRLHGFENEESLESRLSELHDALTDSKQLECVLTRITENLSACYQTLPFFIKHLPFGYCKQYRSNKFQLILQPISKQLPAGLALYKYYSIVAEVDRIKLETVQVLATLADEFEKTSALKRDIQQRKEQCQSRWNSWSEEHRMRWEKVIQRAPDYEDVPLDEMTAAQLDISYRYDLFWLCVHFREAEYIEMLHLKVVGDSERGKIQYEKKLRRLAHITPLFISTFHSLPKFSNYYSREHGETYYRNLFDLMIVDEAGQVAPEVAVASFALTKKILAVGDVNQIEPVSGLTDRIDFFNAKKYGLLSSDQQFEILNERGFMASGCSLMQMVKKSCPYQFTFSNGKTDKGAYLLEHYRCLDEIIRYSNDYVYNGCLEFHGGKNHDKNHSLPPMGYIHINGMDEPNNGSRQNDMEARVIAEWLFNNCSVIEKAYGKGIGEVLAVIAPFAAQVRLIRKYVGEMLGEKTSASMTIGTVHSLQGAGREIILFSSVYGKNNGRMFFDLRNKYNMLNVATTRAKHSFLVFGNMRIFQPQSDTPSGNLAKVLFSKESYNLDQNFIYSSERIYSETNQYTVRRISTLEKHRSCLKYCFDTARNRLLIFSPFISIAAINADEISDLVGSTCARGVDVVIITDEYLDKINGKLKGSAEAGRIALQKAGGRLIVYKGIHNKTICVDDKLLIEGSFNWLSAVRDENSSGCRKETSVMLQGEGVDKMIDSILCDFELNN